jgi:pimeloyl-ACP methyl ester carboxylesterase
MERFEKWIESLGIGRRIDEMGRFLRHWPHVKKISIISIGLAIIFWIAMIPAAFVLEKEVKEYYQTEGINYEPFAVTMPSRYTPNIPSTVTIHGIAYYPENAPDAMNGTFPTILQVNGANNRKERNQDMTFELVKRGMAVFVIEQRGHGESTGRASFYGEEPGDIPYILDYITNTYPWVNSTHFGALGFSLGAGCLLIAQALDSRIYACSLFHPPTDIGGIFQQVDVLHITGSALFQRPSYALKDVDPMTARTAFYWCNSSNTKNILLIQGDADTKVPAEGTKKFYEQKNFQPEDEVQLIIRPGLAHEPNEADPTSRKYAISWLLSFFGDDATKNAIDRTNLTQYIPNIELYSFKLPNRSILSGLAWTGIVFFEIGLLFYGIIIRDSKVPIVVKKIKQRIAKKIKNKLNLSLQSAQKDESNENDENLAEKTPEKAENTAILNAQDPQVLFMQQMLVLAILILPTAIILAIINGFSNPNLIFGLFFELPIITGLIFHFARIYYNKSNHKAPLRLLEPFPFEAPVRGELELEITSIMTALLLIPPLIGMGIYDWGAKMVLLWPANPWKGSLFVYSLAFSALFYVSYAFVDPFLEEKSYLGATGLAFVWGLAASQYILFNPVTATFGMVTLSLILVFGFALAMIFMGMMQRALKRIFGKVIVTEIITAEIIGLYIVINFMNII